MIPAWLVKSEPESYSFDDLCRDGTTVWDGVKNPLALKYLRQMKLGEQVFFYHSGAERAIVGIATVVTGPRPDAAANDAKLVVVDLAAGMPLRHPVALAALKKSGKFVNFPLVRLPRLSVMPVSPAEAKLLLSLAEG